MATLFGGGATNKVVSAIGDTTNPIVMAYLEAQQQAASTGEAAPLIYQGNQIGWVNPDGMSFDTNWKRGSNWAQFRDALEWAAPKLALLYAGGSAMQNAGILDGATQIGVHEVVPAMGGMTTTPIAGTGSIPTVAGEIGANAAVLPAGVGATTAELGSAGLGGLGGEDLVRLGLGVGGALYGASQGGGNASGDLAAQLALNRQVRDLNLVGQQTPFGSSQYAIDPVTGMATRTDALSPEMQSQFNQVSGNLGTAMGALGQPFDPNAYGDVLRTIDYSQPIQMQLNAQGLPDLTSDFSKERDDVYNALLSRYNPRLDERFTREEENLRSRLANMGAAAGSEFYNRELSDFGRTKSDAYRDVLTEALLQSGNEQQRLNQMRLGNRGQLFGEALQGGQFANQAQQQGFGQALNRSQFANQGQQQAFGQGLQARQQAANEVGLFGDLQRQTAGYTPQGFNAQAMSTPNAIQAAQADRQDQMNNALLWGNLASQAGNIFFGK